MNNQPVLVRLPNWLGDAVMALPALYDLARADYSVTVVGKPWMQAIFTHTPWPFIPTQSTIRQHINALRQHSARDYLALPNSFSSAAHGFMAGKRVYGYRGDWRTMMLYRHWRAPSQVHESEKFWRLIRYYCQTQGAMPSWHAARSAVPFDIAPDASLQALLDQASSRPLVLLCPFALGVGAHGALKVWPHWAELMTKLSVHCHLVCAPGPTEAQAAAAYANLPIKILPDLNLSAYIALMRSVALVIGNDTGPMHLAAWVNRQTMTLFGVSDPARTAPLGSEVLGQLGAWPDSDEVVAWALAKL